MDRYSALQILNDKVKNKNLIKHCLATEIVMEYLAKHFGEDEKLWGMAGLLHDLDYENAKEDWSDHGLLTEEWLKGKELPQGIFDIIKAHNSDVLHYERKTVAEKAIYAVDPLTGLIVAAALMVPEKKISQLSAASVLKRFRASGFAKGANRDQIKTCADFGLSLEEFISIALEAMQSINKELGL